MNAGAFVSFAVQAWGSVLVAVLIARYVRRGVRMPDGGWSKAGLVIASYVATLLTQLALQATDLGAVVLFVLPIVVGAATARSLMLHVGPRAAD